MRYVITKDQFHKVIYSILDGIVKDGRIVKENNPYSSTGGYDIALYDGDTNNEDNIVLQYYYFPSDDDEYDGYSEERGKLHVNFKLDNKLKNLLSIRQSKILDIIGDWVSDKFNVDVDEVVIYPNI
jgi:hypothetical protein